METTDLTKLIASLGDWKTWMVVPVIASLAGALGGWAKRLTSPPEDKTPVLGYLVVGAVASLAALFILTPQEGVKLIAQCLAAGYGGKAILEAMQERVKTALARKEADDAKAKGKEAVEAGKEAVDKAQELARMHREVGKALTGDTLEKLTVRLPADVESLVSKIPETTEQDLTRLAFKLDSLKASFEK